METAVIINRTVLVVLWYTRVAVLYLNFRARHIISLFDILPSMEVSTNFHGGSRWK